MLRQAAVAGQFYSRDRDDLYREVASFVSSEAAPQGVVGAMVPHAGYIYSGAVAGAVFSRIEIPHQVVILGPNHHGFGHAGAVYAAGGWQTPLGTTPVAASLAADILAHCPLLSADSLAHRHEHSLEVQLPFLQILRRDVEIVPICLGQLGLDDLLAIADGLAAVCARQKQPPLLLASSDMSHYEPGTIARRKDQLAIDRILALDPEGLYQTVRREQISMCGVLPTVVLLAAGTRLGAGRAELVRYANSGDVTGDQSEVVGYAGITLL